MPQGALFISMTTTTLGADLPHLQTMKLAVVSTPNVTKKNIAERIYCYENQACNHSYECFADEICANQRCMVIDGCKLDSDCGDGRYCDAGNCALIGTCQADLECPVAMHCSVDGHCLALPSGHCIVDDDCFDGRQCSIAGYCRN